MESVKVIAICPECGDSNWYHREDGDFECVACGEVCSPEDMQLTCTDDKM